MSETKEETQGPNHPRGGRPQPPDRVAGRSPAAPRSVAGSSREAPGRPSSREPLQLPRAPVRRSSFGVCRAGPRVSPQSPRKARLGTRGLCGVVTASPAGSVLGGHGRGVGRRWGTRPSLRTVLGLSTSEGAAWGAVTPNPVCPCKDVPRI